MPQGAEKGFGDGHSKMAGGMEMPVPAPGPLETRQPPSPSQYEEKDKAFKEQLSHLATLLPTLQVQGAWGAGGSLLPGQALSSVSSPRSTWSSVPPSSAWPPRLSSWTWAM